MSHIVSITSQGQITIPAKLRRNLGLKKKGRALVRSEEGKIIIEPVKDILELAGSLNYLTNKKRYNPRKAREMFERHLARQAVKGISKRTLKKLGFKKIAPYTYAPPKSFDLKER